MYGSISSLAYDKNAFGDVNTYNKPFVVWSRTESGDGYAAPDTIADDEFVISVDTLKSLAQKWELTTEQFLAHESFEDLINGYVTLEISRNSFNDSVFRLTNMKIAAVVDGYDAYRSFMLSENTASRFLSAVGGYDCCYFKSSSESALKSQAKELSELGYKTGSALTDIDILSEFESILGTMAKVFLYIALVMFVLAFFIIFNYISTSVRFRTKEIAVYRVIGAKTSDVSKIFLAEGGAIVIRTSIAAIIISFLVSLILNSLLSSIMSAIGMSFSLLQYNWLIEPLAIILGASLTVALSSFVPVLRITAKRPVEAVKLI